MAISEQGAGTRSPSVAVSQSDTAQTFSDVITAVTLCLAGVVQPIRVQEVKRDFLAAMLRTMWPCRHKKARLVSLFRLEVKGQTS